MSGPPVSAWDDRFSGDSFVYGTEPNAFLAEEASRLAPGARVLCLGDGEGRNGVYLASLGHAVTSLDQSAVGLAKAARLAASRGLPLTTLHADLADWAGADAAWDAIVLVFCHLPEGLRRAVHRAVPRWLAPGGLVVLTAYRPEQVPLATGGPKDVALLPTLDEVLEDFSGLDPLVARAVERDVVEGTLHTGRAATLEVVARRAP